MFSCSCCLCKGPCGASGPSEGLAPAVPSPLLDLEVLVPEGVDDDLRSAAETAGQPLHQDRRRNPNTGDPKTPAHVWPRAPVGDMPPPVAILPTPMQLKWNSSADKRKNSRLHPLGNKPIQRSWPSDVVRSRMDSFFRPPSWPSPQVSQAHGPLHQFPDVRAEVLFDSEAGELLYVTSTNTGQPIPESNNPQPFEFMVYDHAYPSQTSFNARSRSGVNRPSGYLSLTGTNWVCGETITSTLHIIARAEGWGLEAMPPQQHQTVWLGDSFWSENLCTKGSGSPFIDPAHDAGITGSFVGPKPKESKNAEHATRTALFHRALQVTAVYVRFNLHSNHWVYFKIELATHTITLHDPLPPQLRTQAIDTRQILHTLAEWVAQVKQTKKIIAYLALKTTEASPVFSEPATSFCTVTFITQKDGFQCAVFCIGNIVADTSNRPARVRRQICENVGKYVGLLLWLNSELPIALSLEQKTLFMRNFPPGSVVDTAHLLSHSVIPGPSASELIRNIIRHMIQEIGDTPLVMTAPLLTDWAPVALTVHSSPNPQGRDAARTCTRPFPQEGPGLNSSARLTGLGDKSDSDCQMLDGPEPNISLVEGRGQNSKVPTSDVPGEQRGKKQARPGEEKTLLLPRTRVLQDLEWKQKTLQVGPGLNNLDDTCFCNVVLQCLTHTALLANFCLDRGHSSTTQPPPRTAMLSWP